MYKFIPIHGDCGNSDRRVTKHYVLVNAIQAETAGCVGDPRNQGFSVSFDVPNDVDGGITRFSASETWQELLTMVLANGAYMEHFVDQIITITQPPIVQQLIHEVGLLTNTVHILQRELLGTQVACGEMNTFVVQEIERLKSQHRQEQQRQEQQQQSPLPPPPPPPPPPQEQVQLTSGKKSVVPCRHYARKRFCLYGENCRFAHVDL